MLSLINLGTFILNSIFRNLSEKAFVAPDLILLVSGFSLLNTHSSIHQHQPYFNPLPQSWNALHLSVPQSVCLSDRRSVIPSVTLSCPLHIS